MRLSGGVSDVGWLGLERAAGAETHFGRFFLGIRAQDGPSKRIHATRFNQSYICSGYFVPACSRTANWYSRYSL
jgi:hypothetical protein